MFYKLIHYLLVVFAALLLLLVSCGTEEEIQEEIIRPVRFTQVFSSGGSRIRSFSGVAQAGLESQLSFKVPGTIQDIKVKVGDKVNAGDLLAELDPQDYQLQVRRAEASHDQAKAQLRNASAQYDRIRILFENNNASRTDLDTSQTAYESAMATVSASEQSLELARLQFEWTKLISPVDGSIAEVRQEINENVSAGLPIFVMTSGSHIEVTVSVPEVLIAKIKEGSEVTVTFDALPDKEFSAIVREVGITSAGTGTTYPVIVRLDDTDPNIRPGMASMVSYTFESESNRSVILVPSHVIGEDREEQRFVYVVEPLENDTGIVRKKLVTIGEYTTEGIEVFDGLDDGDFIVTAGISKLKDGMTVKLLVKKEN